MNNAKAADPMQHVDNITPGQSASYEDLGGPTPENYKPDDDSAKLRPKVKTVSDVVNKGQSRRTHEGCGQRRAEVEEEEIVKA